MRITRTLATALGIAAIAASTAQARPIEDIHTPLINATAHQSTQSLHPDHAGDPQSSGRPQSPGHPSEVGRLVNAPGATASVPSPAPAQPADSESGVDWLMIALGVAGSLLAVSGLAALNARRTRVPA
jgi:hypothetical protein